MATEFPYPPKPWYNGQEVTVANDDGTVTVATYDQPNNTWHITIKYADITDDYIYTDHVLTVNDELPVDRLKEAYDGVDAVEEPGDLLPTQESVNNALAIYAAAATRKGLRTEDQLNFSQDARTKGIWVSEVPDQQGQLPSAGYFYAFQDFIPVNEFNQVNRMLFAGEGTESAGGIFENSLTDAKVGDYLIVQTNNDPDFGGYVITYKEIIGQPDLGGQWWVLFYVVPVRQGQPDERTNGGFETGDHCTVKVTRPVFMLPQSDQPVVPAEGYMWFKSDTHELYVSTRGDTDPEEPGVDQWVKIGPGGGGVSGDYLPLTGGTLTGNLNVGGQLKVTGANEFKVENSDATNFLRVRPDNGTITAKGQMSVNDLFDVKADVVEYQKNRTSISQMGPREVINAGILDNLMRAPTDGYLKDYLPLTGGELTGQLTIKKNNQVALEIVGDSGQSQIKFWSSGAVALQNYTNFQDNELVTKKYVDDAVAAGGDVNLDEYVSKAGQNQKITGDFQFYGTGTNEVIRVNQGSTVASSVKYKIFADGGIEQKGKHIYKFPLAGGVVVDVQSNNESTAKIWADGTFTTTKTTFSDDQLVTKKYVDDNAGGFTPGNTVAKTGNSGIEVGGFYITSGNLYVKVS